MSKVVTANTLATGIVVFRAVDGTWTPEIARAEVFADMELAEAALTAAKRDETQAIIIEPFVVDTGPENNGSPAMTLRDTIRAFGPTIQFLPADTAARG